MWKLQVDTSGHLKVFRFTLHFARTALITLDPCTGCSGLGPSLSSLCTFSLSIPMTRSAPLKTGTHPCAEHCWPLSRSHQWRRKRKKELCLPDKPRASGEWRTTGQEAGGCRVREGAHSWLPSWCQWQRIHLPMQNIQGTQVPSLSWKDALEEVMATHSSIPAWRIPWTEEPGGVESMGCNSTQSYLAKTNFCLQLQLQYFVMRTPFSAFKISSYCLMGHSVATQSVPYCNSLIPNKCFLLYYCLLWFIWVDSGSLVFPYEF